MVILAWVWDKRGRGRQCFVDVVIGRSGVELALYYYKRYRETCYRPLEVTL